MGIILKFISTLARDSSMKSKIFGMYVYAFAYWVAFCVSMVRVSVSVSVCVWICVYVGAFFHQQLSAKLHFESTVMHIIK